MADINEMNGGDVVSGVDTVKKSGKGALIAAGAAGVIVVGGAVGCVAAYSLSDFVKNQVKLRVSSPENYYSWVTEKNSAALSQQLSTRYREVLDATQEGQSSTFSLKFDVSDSAKDMLLDNIFGSDIEDSELDEETQSAVDIIKNFNSAKIGMSADSKKTASSGSAYVEFNDQRLATFEMSMDTAAMDLFFRVPELTERWIAVDGTKIAEDEGMKSEFDAYRKVLENPGEVLTPEEISKEIDRYVGVWNSSFDEIELKKGEEVQIADIKMKYTVASVNVDAAKANEIAKNFVTSAKEDDILRSVLVDRTGAMTSEEYNDYLNEMLDDIENGNFADEEDDAVITVNTFIDPKGGIRGVEVIEDEEEGNRLYFLMGKEGDQIRGEGYFMDGGEKDITIDINAVEQNKKVSGTIDVMADEEEVSVEFKDAEVVNEKKGYMNGTYTLVVPDIDPISLVFSSDGKSQQISYQVVVEGTDFGKLTLEYSANDGADPSVVSKDGAFMIDGDLDVDIADYVEKAQMEDFLNGVLAKVGLSEDMSKQLVTYAVASMYNDYSFDWDIDDDDDDYDWDIDDDIIDATVATENANKAYVYIADEKFAASYLGTFGSLSEGEVMADIKGNGTYTASVKAVDSVEPKGISILKLSIDEFTLDGDPDIEIKSIKIDGKEMPIVKEPEVLVYSGIVSVMIYANEDYAYNSDKSIIDGSAVEEWESIEITFEMKGLK